MSVTVREMNCSPEAVFAVRGPGRLVPSPVADALLAVRDRETLSRLAHLAEGREGNHEALITGQGEDALPEQVDGEGGAR